MSSLFDQSELKDLIEKVERGERLDFNAGIRMINSQDILALGYMANLVRERKNGNRTYFKVTGHMNYPNIYSDLGDSDDLSEIHLMGKMNISEERYLEIQEAAHRTGMFTNATMFYGSDESTEERIEYLLKLRELQDRTGGFLSFMPHSYENSTGFEDLKILSVSRILLDNVNHIKAFCNVLGPKLTQVSLNFGVDDLDNHLMTKQALIHLIEKARREAVERAGKE